MYFYRNGTRFTTLQLQRQIAELVGYAIGGVFYGWIVLSISDLMPTVQYGKSLNILAHGTAIGTSSNASISYRMANGGKIDNTQYSMSVSRQSQGLYRVSFPTQWNLGTNYIVMVTGYGAAVEDGISPIKPTVKSKSNGYFDVWVSDDGTVNDGSFEFQIFNYYDI